MKPAPRRVVYVTYDGLSEPLGQSQILPYLRGLARLGHQFHVITFEKPGAPAHPFRQLEPGISVTSLRYHKSPTVPATAFDTLQGWGTIPAAAALLRADLVHVRSYLPALMSLPLVLGTRRPLLFDTRGLWADERVDGGSWAQDSALYRGAKAVERRLFQSADAITVLTLAYQSWLRQEYEHRSEVRAPIRVIPTCTDLDLFNPRAVPDPEITARAQGAMVLAYVGSLGGRYLSQEMGRFYLAFRRAAGGPTRLVIASRDDSTEMRQVLEGAGVADELIVTSVARERVPSLMRASHAGLFFIRTVDAGGNHREYLSTRVCAPTKLGELLACGIPVVANEIADVPRVLEAGDAGVILSGFSEAELNAKAAALVALAKDPATCHRARRTAERWFSLDRAVEAYDELYAAMPRYHNRPVLTGDRSWP